MRSRSSWVAFFCFVSAAFALYGIARGALVLHRRAETNPRLSERQIAAASLSGDVAQRFAGLAAEARVLAAAGLAISASGRTEGSLLPSGEMFGYWSAWTTDGEKLVRQSAEKFGPNWSKVLGDRVEPWKAIQQAVSERGLPTVNDASWFAPITARHWLVGYLIRNPHVSPTPIAFFGLIDLARFFAFVKDLNASLYAKSRMRAVILADGGPDFQFAVPNQADALTRLVDDARAADGAVFRRASGFPVSVLVEPQPGARIPFGSGRDGRLALALWIALAAAVGAGLLGIPAYLGFRAAASKGASDLARLKHDLEAETRKERARLESAETLLRNCEDVERTLMDSSQPIQTARMLCDAVGNLLGRSTVFLGYDVVTAQFRPLHGFGAEARIRPVPVSISARERIREAEKENRVVNLGDHTGLQEQMIAVYEVGHFDAWVVGGRGMFSRYEEAPSILGVLIVLSPDASSHEKNGALLRLIRAAGMAFESQLWLGRSASSPFRTTASTPRDPSPRG